MEAQPIARRCWISGRVQGVYYRASAREHARRHAIAGYARNLPDGRVEVLACGEAGAVAAFVDWLWQGPAAAKVTQVQVDEVALGAADWPRNFTTA